ncbi:hypothetical protein NFI96_021350 [Prochilodus magdalenae]|nr:hypothetical protein NFI96_021350 [Prochilodus magdalenae]
MTDVITGIFLYPPVHLQELKGETTQRTVDVRAYKTVGDCPITPIIITPLTFRWDTSCSRRKEESTGNMELPFTKQGHQHWDQDLCSELAPEVLERRDQESQGPEKRRAEYTGDQRI